MEGRFSPGQSMTVRGLAEEFGVSISPVRAALSALLVERAIVQFENGRIIVPVLSREAFTDLMMTRQLVEGEATTLAARHINADHMDALAQYAVRLDEAATAGNIRQYLELNRRFKSSVYALCHSPSLIFLIDSLWVQVGPFLRFHDRLLKDIARINFHHNVISAFRAGDGAAAAAAIRRDIEAGMERIIAMEEVSGVVFQDAAA